jgi:hypothetical protein
VTRARGLTTFLGCHGPEPTGVTGSFPLLYAKATVTHREKYGRDRLPGAMLNSKKLDLDRGKTGIHAAQNARWKRQPTFSSPFFSQLHFEP